MKQGSADDPFAEEPADDADDAEEDRANAAESDVESPHDRAADTDSGAGSTRTSVSESTSDDAGAGQTQSLPYIHARDGVKDGRTQRPIFLRDHVESGIDELVAQMEDEFGEDVYKTDVTEAAMAIAEENPELVRAKLEEWGYGWT